MASQKNWPEGKSIHNTKTKGHTQDVEHEANLGQENARFDKKESELSHMGERTRRGQGRA